MTNTLEDESYEMELEYEPIADKMKTKEKKSKKSAKNKKVIESNYFLIVKKNQF